VGQRYLRLGVPYLAAILAAVLACGFARPWLEERVVGSAPTWDQLVSHAFFLQFWLGHERLSAGVWYVCIDFQLCLLLAACFLLRDWLGARSEPVRFRWLRQNAVWLIAWGLALGALFFVNRWSEWEDIGVYFFGSYFMGVLVARELESRRWPVWLLVYLAIVTIALAVEWRPRMAVCMAAGGLLYAAGWWGWLERWPNHRVVAFVGQISYSLFLIHLSVLVVVYAIWVRNGWDSPLAGLTGMLTVIVASIAAATIFYRYVEVPSLRLSRRLAARRVTVAAPLVRPADVTARQIDLCTSEQQVAG
jgi:peptidoglycan/LPS O-acetylase OafA/YrhL